MFAKLGLVNFHIELSNCGLNFDDPLGGRFSDDLLVGPAFFRYEDKYIAVDVGRTGQAALFVAIAPQKLGFDVAWRRDVFLSRYDAVFLKSAFLDAYLALGTGLAAAADAFDMVAHLAGGVEKRLPRFYPAAPARGHKDHQWILGSLFFARH
jgi:hypothetical protein